MGNKSESPELLNKSESPELLNKSESPELGNNHVQSVLDVLLHVDECVEEMLAVKFTSDMELLQVELLL